jgi:hypothetical protein
MSGAGGVPFWNAIGPEGGPLLAGTPEKTGFISMMRFTVESVHNSKNADEGNLKQELPNKKRKLERKQTLNVQQEARKKVESKMLQS